MCVLRHAGGDGTDTNEPGSPSELRVEQTSSRNGILDSVLATVSAGSSVDDDDDDEIGSQSDSGDDVALVGARLAGWNGAMDTISTKVDTPVCLRLPCLSCKYKCAPWSDCGFRWRRSGSDKFVQHRRMESLRAGGCCRS